MLNPGTAAPPFAVADLFARPLALSDYRGRTLLLSFFRNAAWAMCNLRVHQLSERFPGLHRAGLDVVAVFESPREAMLQYVGRQDVLCGFTTPRISVAVMTTGVCIVIPSCYFHHLQHR